MSEQAGLKSTGQQACLAKAEELSIYSLPPFAYTWPLVFWGYLMAGFEALGLQVSPLVAGPVYHGTLAVVLLAVGIRMNIWQVAFLGLVALLGYLNIPVVSSLLGTFLYRGGIVQPEFALGLSNTLTAIMVLMFGYLKFNYFSITHGTIVEHIFGQRDVATASAGKQLRSEYPNLLRSVLGCGTGDLVLRDTNGQREVMRINDVAFLYFRFGVIERRLQTFSTIHENDTEST